MGILGEKSRQGRQRQWLGAAGAEGSGVILGPQSGLIHLPLEVSETFVSLQSPQALLRLGAEILCLVTDRVNVRVVYRCPEENCS